MYYSIKDLNSLILNAYFSRVFPIEINGRTTTINCSLENIMLPLGWPVKTNRHFNAIGKCIAVICPAMRSLLWWHEKYFSSASAMCKVRKRARTVTEAEAHGNHGMFVARWPGADVDFITVFVSYCPLWYGYWIGNMPIINMLRGLFDC